MIDSRAEESIKFQGTQRVPWYVGIDRLIEVGRTVGTRIGGDIVGHLVGYGVDRLGDCASADAKFRKENEFMEDRTESSDSIESSSESHPP